jgi:phosphatidate cytidylyltransferase
LAAAGILGPLLLLCWLDDQWNFGRPGIWLAPLAGAVTLLAAAEMVAMARTGGYRPLGWTVFGGCLLPILAASIPLVVPGSLPGTPWASLGPTLIALMITVAMVLIGEMGRYREPGSSTINAALALLPVLYVALPMAMMVHLRLLHQDRWGLLAVVSVLWVVKLSDAGAYFAGRWLGTLKLSRRLSPNKTVEGVLGGLLAGSLASWFFFQLIVRWFAAEPSPAGPWWSWGLYGATLTVAGMLGDLSESLLKRDMEQKDSSSWLPGLGGVLDVVDSLLLAAPVGFLWWALGGVGP